MEKIKAHIAKLDASLHEQNKCTDVLAQIEQKTGLPRLYITLFTIGLLSLYLMVGYGAAFLCKLVGILYPAYASLKAIETTTDKDDDTQWLTYWVVYSCFHFLEFFSDILLAWIPVYWFSKCVFLVWCFAPVSWNGSDLLYRRVIRPLFFRHKDTIESALDKAKVVAMEARDVAMDASKVAKEKATEEMVKRAADAATNKED